MSKTQVSSTASGRHLLDFLPYDKPKIKFMHSSNNTEHNTTK